MERIPVFLSSAMTGELNTERAVLRARFGGGTPLANTFELYLFEEHASPSAATAAYVQAVKRSPVAIFLFSDTLRPAVLEEFEVAIQRCAVFCYLRAGGKRTEELTVFVRNRLASGVQYAEFSDDKDLSQRVENDLLEWIRNLVYREVPPGLATGEVIGQVAPLNSLIAQRFCDAALAESDTSNTPEVPVDLSAHSLWGTVRPRSLGGLPFDRQAEIEKYAEEISRFELNGAIFPTLNAYVGRGLGFKVRVLLLHPDSDQAQRVDRSQRRSRDKAEQSRFALSDIYLTLYVLKVISKRHRQLGLSVVGVMSQEESMAYSVTRIGHHALVAPYPRDELLESAASFTVTGTPGDLTPFGGRLAEFEESWSRGARGVGGYRIELDALPERFEDLRHQLDLLIERDPSWARQPHADPTPFGTRTTLRTAYADQVQAYWDNRDPYPVALEVNPANSCDQGCHWCISENKHHPGSSLDFSSPAFAKFIEDFYRLGGRALGWSGGGEPTNHPRLAMGMKLVADVGISQGLITHGAFAPDLVDSIASHCAWVRVSLDTCNRDDYARKRGRSPVAGEKAFDRVTENVKALVTAGAHVGLNMNIARWNLSQLEDTFEWATSLGVAYLQVRPTLVTPFPHVQDEDLLSGADVSSLMTRLSALERKAVGLTTDLIISRDKFAEIVKSNYGRTYAGCAAHRLFVVLNANGDLAVCMYQMTDRRFILGNVYHSSLESIWASEQRKEVLRFCSRELNHAVHQCQICCKGHEINKVLDGGHGGVFVNKGATSPFL